MLRLYSDVSVCVRAYEPVLTPTRGPVWSLVFVFCFVSFSLSLVWYTRTFRNEARYGDAHNWLRPTVLFLVFGLLGGPILWAKCVANAVGHANFPLGFAPENGPHQVSNFLWKTQEKAIFRGTWWGPFSGAAKQSGKLPLWSFSALEVLSWLHQEKLMDCWFYLRILKFHQKNQQRISSNFEQLRAVLIMKIRKKS